MGDFFDSLKGLFSSAEDKKQPALHEMLERNTAEQDAYQVWSNSVRKDRVMELLKELVHNPTIGSAPPLEIQFVESGKSNGFILYYQQQLMSNHEFQHLFDWLKERVLDHGGYSIYMSDIKRKIKGDAVETKERHYLKPKISRVDKQIDQLFGNITIEHTLVNDKPQHIKFIANIYSDQNFTDALHYRELLKLIVA